MKVALVFDIPDDIEIEKTKVQYITIAEKKTNNYMVQTMKIDCQLRPLPESKKMSDPMDYEVSKMALGWNACLDEIAGCDKVANKL